MLEPRTVWRAATFPRLGPAIQPVWPLAPADFDGRSVTAPIEPERRHIAWPRPTRSAGGRTAGARLSAPPSVRPPPAAAAAAAAQPPVQRAAKAPSACPTRIAGARSWMRLRCAPITEPNPVRSHHRTTQTRFWPGRPPVAVARQPVAVAREQFSDVPSGPLPPPTRHPLEGGTVCKRHPVVAFARLGIKIDQTTRGWTDRIDRPRRFGRPGRFDRSDSAGPSPSTRGWEL